MKTRAKLLVLAGLLCLLPLAGHAAEGINSTAGTPLPLGAGDNTVMWIVPSGTDGVPSGTPGYVGINTGDPQATLDVNGGVKVGSDETCTPQKAGTLSFFKKDPSDTAKRLCLCTENGDWQCLCPAFAHNAMLFTTSVTFKPPSGVSSDCPLSMRVLAVGGGASGSGYGYTAGNGSGRVAAQTVALTSMADVPVTVGFGGVDLSGPGMSGGTSSFGTLLSAAGGDVYDGQTIGGSGGSGGGPTCSSIDSFIACPAGGTNGSNAGNGVKDAKEGGGWHGGSGQGVPIVSSPTTVMELTFKSVTFAAGAGGAGGMTQHDSAPWGYWQNYGAGGGGGGILINGANNPSAGQGQAGGGYGGQGFGGGGGGAGRPNAVYSYVGGSGAPGFVYVEW